MKKLLATIMALLLVVSLFPSELVKRAEAATTSAATYFIPDITDIRNTATLTTNVPPTDPLNPPDTALSRKTAYKTNSGTLTIGGALTSVSGTTLSAKIEQLNLNADATWSSDSNHFTTGTINVDPANSNRFIASNLTLYSGMNKITFTGLQNGLQRSDVFYILFDQVPYIQSLKVTSGASLADLNEGAQAVVPNQTVSIQGVAKNATRVTAGIAGGTQVVAPVYEDGLFFTPAFNLNPGKNTINLTVTNGSNTINIIREIYYFDKDKPFTSAILTIEGAEFELKDNVPQVTVGSTDITDNQAANLKVQMLVNYEAAATPFAGTATYSINGSTPPVVISSTEVDEEVIIPGTDGITPAYRLVTFTLPADFPLQISAGAYKKDQQVALTINYGTTHVSFPGKFKYLPGETVIQNMYYLPDFDPTKPGADIATASKAPLTNAEVNNASFYILVESDSDINPPQATLTGKLLPISTTPVTVTLESGVTNTSANATKQQVYLVTDFPNGQQKVEFKLNGSSSSYVANISYVSKSYIYIANLFDGQSFKYDSDTPHTITISGEYIGFNGVPGTPQFFVNGKELTTTAFEDDVQETTGDKAKFSIDLQLGTNDPINDVPDLVYGENRIIFKGINTIGTGNTQLITKEIKIYIEDLNKSTVEKFMPTLDVASRQEFVADDVTSPLYTQEIMNKIFAVTPEFLYKDGKYTTSETSYDLVIKGGGARTLNLKLGTDTIVTVPIPDNPELHIDVPFDIGDKHYIYDFAGNEESFIVRVEGIPFAAPGTHVYNLELINRTGAITNQALEITREVSPYRLLSPVATVGNQIIVNKNFVHFDIEAEGATDVLIEGEKATKRSDMNNRFIYDYVGLKADKLSEIKIQIVRAGNTLNDKVRVYYSSSVQSDSQFMQKLGTKFSVFNKGLQLTFPKGTVLKSVGLNDLMAPKLYNDTNLLFGIANPIDGVVERKNDYGNIIGVDYDARTNNGASQIIIPDRIALRFANNANTSNFTRISNIYWISGGIGEQGNRGDLNYKPATNGLPPYSIEGNFTEYEAGRKVVPSNRGTLTLSFDGSVVEDVSYMVTVFRYTDAGVWENIGGSVNAKAHTITVPFDEFGYYQVVKLRKGFSDVTNHGWARNILNALYSKGIMTNMRVDEFGANDLTTRGEFATLLVKGLNLPMKAEGNQTFFDISPGTKTSTWDYEHIETAARAGIVNGLSEGFFGPDIRITREDAAVMIAKALQLKMSVNDGKLEANLAKAFVDSGSMHIYARPAIEAVNKAKIMTGSPTTIPGQTKPLMSFNPKGNMTRAEAGKIAVALLQKNTSIFPKNLS